MVIIATKCTTFVRLIPMYVHRDEWKDEWNVTKRSIMHLKNKCITVGGSNAVGVLCNGGLIPAHKYWKCISRRLMFQMTVITM